MLTTLVFAGLGAAIVGLAAASAVAWMRARARESSAIETDAVAADGLTEMRALGQRIETLVGQQQLQGATDRQHLAQKIDAVGEHIEQQRNGLSGLQNELRHEVSRRDAEMDEIRTQLASIQHATALGAGSAPLALPPAADTPAADLPHEEPWTFETPSFDMHAVEMPTAEASESDAQAVDLPSEEAPVFESMEAGAMEAASEASAFPAEPMGDGLAADFGESPFAPTAFDDAWDTGTAASSDRTPEAPAQPVFSDPFAFVDPFAALPPAAPPAAAPPAAEDDEAAVAAGSEFEPLDVAPPPDPFSEDESLPLDPPSVALPSLFEDVSFGGSAGFAFEDVTALAASASPPPEAPVHFPPAPPSDSAWIARANPPTADVPTFASTLGAAPDAALEAPVTEAPTFETPAFEAPAFEAPAFETPSGAPPSVAPPAFEEPTVQPPALPTPAAEAPAPPPVPPTSADDLTVISTVTDDIQRLLYAAGVTSLDEIARWSRTDARRLSTIVSVPEETILNQWVFEAQAALFQSFRA